MPTSDPTAPAPDSPPEAKRRSANLFRLAMETSDTAERLEADHDSLNYAPEDEIGPYRLMRKLGDGGFGVVWEAEQQRPLKRRVALKIIKAGMDTARVVARFANERQALALMDHPNIARIYDAGSTLEGRPYFAMEIVNGLPITSYCDEHRLDLRARIRLFMPVCMAVQHAHQKGILHRDLKPSNILVAEVDGAPSPKIIDFGIAKALESDSKGVAFLLTQDSSVIGTPPYMSPEQATLGGAEVDSRADVYALGAVLHELLAGMTPLGLKPETSDTSLIELMRMIQQHDPDRPSTKITTHLKDAEFAQAASARQASPRALARQLKGELDYILLKALYRDREMRYASSAALADDLQKFLNDEPISARPPSLPYQVGKFARRHRTAVAAAAMVVTALAVGLILSTYALVQEASMRRTAQAMQAKAEQQEQLAESNEAKALQESERARKTLSYITGLLDKAGQYVDQGKNPEALRLAVEASAKELSELDSEPDVQVELCGLLARIYDDLDELNNALRLLRQQRSLRLQLHGPDDLRTIDATVHLARMEGRTGNPNGALSLLDEVIASLSSRQQKSNKRLILAVRDRAKWLAQLGRIEESVTQFESMRKSAALMMGTQERITLLRSYAEVLRDAERLPQVLDILKEARALAGGSSVTDRHNLAMILMDEGRCLRAMGQFAEATDRFLQGISLEADGKGSSRALLIDRWIEVSRVQLMNHDYRGALASCREGLSIARTTGHASQLPHTLRALAQTARQSLHLREAIAAYTELYPLEKVSDSHNILWLDDMASVACLTTMTGDAKQGRELALRTWSLAETFTKENQGSRLSAATLASLAAAVRSDAQSVVSTEDANLLRDWCTQIIKLEQEALSREVQSLRSPDARRMVERWLESSGSLIEDASSGMPSAIDINRLADALDTIPAATHPSDPKAAPLLLRLGMGWQLRGRHAEGLHIFDDALSLPELANDTPAAQTVRLDLLSAKASSTAACGQLEEAGALIDRTLAESQADEERTARTSDRRALNHLHQAAIWVHAQLEPPIAAGGSKSAQPQAPEQRQRHRDWLDVIARE